MLKQVFRILSNSNSEYSNLPKTYLYNEGWMLRLTLNFFSLNDIKDFPLSFNGRKNWYSEALLPTQFKPQILKDTLGEHWSHADGVYGDFIIGKGAKEDLQLQLNPKVFVVLEAKMFSKFTPSVTHAKYYNQAARTVACIAEVLNIAKVEPKNFQKLGFYVLAPTEIIDKEGSFSKFTSKEHIKKIVYERVTEYSSIEKSSWYDKKFLPLIEKIDIALISWEEIISVIMKRDMRYGQELKEFYEKCKFYNRLKKRSL
jgi:hypothetical protein